MVISQVRIIVLILGSAVYYKETQATGTPFDKINGPKSKNDKILIVGAGSSGIHMAYKLQELGFKHVKVFEKSGRIGGKVKTVYNRHVPQEMGAIYTTPDYDEIFKLVNEFLPNDLLNMPPLTTVTNINGSNVALSALELSLKTVADVKGITDPANATAYFQAAVVRYVSIHLSLFGVYEGELMPRPSQQVLDSINLSYLDFLKRNDLEVMKAIAFLAITVQGYGFLDEIPAFYGLMWLTPNFLTKYLAVTPGDSPIKILSKGFQLLWEEMARQRSLDVRFYHDVKYICRKKRQGRPPILVKYQRMQCDVKQEYFDFVITTPYLKEMIESGQFKPNKQEYALFSPAVPSYFTTTLLDSTYGNRAPSPRTLFVDLDSNVPDGMLMALRDSYASIQNITGQTYQSGLLPGGPDNQTIQTSVFYQFSKRKQTPRCLRRLLKKEMKKKMNMEPVQRVTDQETWTYFPSFSKEKLTSGVLWDIYDIQGKYGMWYIGSSVCFETLKSVVEYNLLLLRNYDVPAL